MPDDTLDTPEARLSHAMKKIREARDLLDALPDWPWRQHGFFVKSAKNEMVAEPIGGIRSQPLVQHFIAISPSLLAWFADTADWLASQLAIRGWPEKSASVSDPSTPDAPEAPPAPVSRPQRA